MSMRKSLTCYNVTKTLHELWDPIGCGVPEDEYEHYAEVVLRLLQQKNSEELIVLYLTESCHKSMWVEADQSKILLTLDRFVEYGWLKRNDVKNI